MQASTLPDGPIAEKTPADPHHAVWALLESVKDPEIPVVSLREMGILRAVRDVGGGGLEVVITPTYSGCPAMSQMHDDVANALSDAGIPARVVLQLAPAWSTDWMTPEASAKLRAYGIAPPSAVRCGGSRKGVGGVAHAVACPRCGSENTTETSHFGSTACKALYRCLACMEPFDYFKPY